LLRDPAQLLDRAPELAALAEAVPSVARALARGNAHAVYRALWWARALGKVRPPHHATADALLSHRRLFLMSLRRMPVLQTMNGVGASVYGSQDQDADGTYVKTHFVVFAFVPLFPLTQYLVRDAAKGWYFLGKLPMSLPFRLWNRVVVFSILGVLAAGCWRVFRQSREHDVHVVNGLPAAVHVLIGKTAYDVPANSRRTATVGVGLQPVRVATLGGTALESGEMRVEAGRDLQAWNVAGAAALYLEAVTYGTPSGGPAGEPHLFCGERAVRCANVDDAFIDSPASVSLPEGQPGTTRWHVALAPNGLDVCAGMLSRQHRAEATMALARTLAILDDDSGKPVALATVLARGADQLDEAAAFAEQSLAKHPDSVEHHRIYQSVQEARGLRAALRATYKSQLDRSPGSPDAAYLYARVLPRAEAVLLARSFLTRFPSHVPLHRTLIFNDVRAQQFAAALPTLEHLRTLDPRAWTDYVEEHLIVLAGLDRREEAKKVATEAFTSNAMSRDRLAGLYFWLSGSGPGAETLAARLPHASPTTAAECRVRFWTAAPDFSLAPFAKDPDRPILEVIQQAHYHPRDALDAAARLPQDRMPELGVEVASLLLAESVRTGHAAARERLATAAVAFQMPVRQMEDYVMRGAWSEDLDELSLSAEGALHLVRSRAVAGTERARLRDLAGRCDPIGGFIRRALNDWPSP
jgi:hypothetical protein